MVVDRHMAAPSTEYLQKYWSDFSDAYAKTIEPDNVNVAARYVVARPQ